MTYGTGKRGHSHQISADSTFATTPLPSSRPGKREKLGKTIAANDDDNADEDDEDGGSGDRPHRGGEKPATQGPPWACVYHKWAPFHYSQCGKLKLSRPSDVRQHIRRKHQQPPYCERCGFVPEGPVNARAAELSEHRRRPEGCEVQEFTPPAGATPDQLQALSRSPAPLANLPPHNAASQKERRWFGMFETVFPETKLPESPYQTDSEGTAFSGKLSDFIQTYINQDGPQQAAEALVDTVPGDVSSLAGLCRNFLYHFQCFAAMEEHLRQLPLVRPINLGHPTPLIGFQPPATSALDPAAPAPNPEILEHARGSNNWDIFEDVGFHSENSLLFFQMGGGGENPEQFGDSDRFN